MAEKRTIARPYAQALFNLASDQGELAHWSQMLALAAAVASDPQLVQLADDPRLSRTELGELFVAICGDGLDPQGVNLIRLLIENQRLLLLPEIAALYEEAKAAAEQTVHAEVTAAVALSEAQQQAMGAALKQRFGHEVSIECRVDPALLGGAVIRAGDMVIDGSVASRLERMRQQMLQ